MLREKTCPYCKKIFFYENGIDSHGVAISRNDHALKAGNKDKIKGYCPICVDPHAIPGMTYKKTTILFCLRKHLVDKGIQQQYLDDDSLKPMLKEFPTANHLYNTASTYLTFTLLPSMTFVGKYGEFMLGGVRMFVSRNKKQFHREIICQRCNGSRAYDTKRTLEFFLGMKRKLCRQCDIGKYTGNRNISGLNRNGSKPKEFSSRSLAKALNVSKNDFLRHHITKPEPPLPIGTEINGLRIEEAFWCTKTCSPRYVLVCDGCNNTFTVSQKRAHLQQHFCTGK